jgi:hypothetical protein
MKEEVTVCKCGCNQSTKKNRAGRYNKYIRGHNPSNQRDNAGKWKPGKSGNSAGCRTGSRNKASLAVENLFIDEQERLTRTCIDLALNGNMQALKLAIDRICPVRRDSPIRVDLPRITSISDANELTVTLLDHVATGKLTPSQGELLSRMVEKHVKVLQLNDLELRLASLEEKLNK